MSFSIVLSQSFTTPVVVRVANNKGVVEESKFTATFKRLPIPELDAMALARGDGAPGRSAFIVDEVRAVLEDWSGVNGPDGALPFNAENVELMLLIPQAVRALHAAFWLDAYGAREKN